MHPANLTRWRRGRRIYHLENHCGARLGLGHHYLLNSIPDHALLSRRRLGLAPTFPRFGGQAVGPMSPKALVSPL